MNHLLYHQIENTNGSELSTGEYSSNSPEFTAPHFHKNFELLIAKKGSCSFFIGRDEYFLSEGEAIFVLPFQIHSYDIKPDSVIRCVTFSELLILTLARQLEKKKLKNPVFRPSGNALQFFLSSFSLLFDNKSCTNLQLPYAKRMKVKGCLYTIGGEMLEQAQPIDLVGTDTVFTDIVEYIEDNFKRDLSLRDVAESKGYNYQYLSRCFNRTFGMSFKSMLNQYRTNYALTLLRDTTLSLSEIAFESGFQSIRSFDYSFQKKFGKPPKEFRKSTTE